MRPLIVATCSLVLTSNAYAQEPDWLHNPEWRVVDVSALAREPSDITSDGSRIHILSTPDRAPVLSDDQATGAWAAGAVLVDTLVMQQSVLIEVSDRVARSMVPGFSDEATFLSLTIDGEELVFSALESRADPAMDGVRHLTAVMPNSDGYARFAIDGEAVAVVGTVHTPGDRYRVLSIDSEGTALVFRMPAVAEGSGNRYLGLGQFLSGSPEIQPVRQLEQRHLVAEALGYTQPARYFDLRRDGSGGVVIEGDPERPDRLPRLDVSALESPDVITRFLNEIAPLTGVKGDEQYDVRVEAGSRVPGWRVRFRQLINGIPLSRVNQLDMGPEGELHRLSIQMLDPAEFTVERPLMTRDEAVLFALAELQPRFPGSDIQKREGEVVFDRQPEQRLVPRGQFDFEVIDANGAGRRYRAFVRMHTAEVEVGIWDFSRPARFLE